MQHVLVALQQKNHLAAAFQYLQFSSLDARGCRPICFSPLHATGYDLQCGRLLSESL